MTNEEKILRMLEGMQGQLSEVQQEQKDMRRQLSALDQRQEGMQGQLSEVQQEQKDMREQLSEVQQEQKDMRSQLSEVRQEQKDMRSQLSAMDQRQEAMQGQLSEVQQEQRDMRGQLDENTQIIKAIRHNQEFMSAKLEGLEATTAKADTVARLQEHMIDLKKDQLAMNENITFLVQKTMEHSNEIQRFRQAR